MGCVCTLMKDDADVSNEELVRMYEDSLGFGSLAVEKIASQLIENYSHNLTPRQTIGFLTSLRLRTPDLRDINSPLTNFYSRFCDNKKYPRAKLALLSLLLSQSDVREKCKLIETFYVWESDDEMEAMEMLRDLCEIALVLLPMYAYLELQFAQDKASVAKLTKYMDKLRSSKLATLKHLKHHLLSSTEPFVLLPGKLQALSSKAPIASLFSSKSLRALAATVPRDDPRPKVISILKTPSTSPLTTPTLRRSVKFASKFEESD